MRVPTKAQIRKLIPKGTTLEMRQAIELHFLEHYTIRDVSFMLGLRRPSVSDAAQPVTRGLKNMGFIREERSVYLHVTDSKLRDSRAKQQELSRVREQQRARALEQRLEREESERLEQERRDRELEQEVRENTHRVYPV